MQVRLGDERGVSAGIGTLCRFVARRASKLKALLRKAAARVIDQLWRAVAKVIETFTPTECSNYFKAAGYELD